MTEPMLLVLIYRPEADDYPGPQRPVAHHVEPFAGIEVLGVCRDDIEANALIDGFEGDGRKFMIEPLPDPDVFWRYVYATPCGSKMTGVLRLHHGQVEIGPLVAHGGHGSVIDPGKWRAFQHGPDDARDYLFADDADHVEDWFAQRQDWSLVRIDPHAIRNVQEAAQ